MDTYWTRDQIGTAPDSASIAGQGLFSVWWAILGLNQYDRRRPTLGLTWEKSL